MERSRILGAGVWTAIGLAAAFAVVGATAGRHTTTAAKACPAAKATSVAATDDCCASEAKAPPAVAAVTKAEPEAKAVKAAAPKAAPEATSQPAGSAGMVVGIDPESGSLGMPSAQQMQDLRLQVAPVEGPVTTTTMPDGSVRLNLNGTGVEYATVHVDAKGKKVFGCTSDPKAAEQPAPTPVQLEEK